MKGRFGVSMHLGGRSILHKEGEKCPACNSSDHPKGGTLKRRKGKYGDFLGCSLYPKCHYLYSLFFLRRK